MISQKIFVVMRNLGKKYYSFESLDFSFVQIEIEIWKAKAKLFQEATFFNIVFTQM